MIVGTPAGLGLGHGIGWSVMWIVYRLVHLVAHPGLVTLGLLGFSLFLAAVYWRRRHA